MLYFIGLLVFMTPGVVWAETSTPVADVAVCIRGALTEARQGEAKEPGFLLTKEEREKVSACTKGAAVRPALWPLGQEVKQCLQDKWQERFEKIVSREFLPSQVEAGSARECVKLVKGEIGKLSKLSEVSKLSAVSYRRLDYPSVVRQCVQNTVGVAKYLAFAKGPVELTLEEKAAFDKCLFKKEAASKQILKTTPRPKADQPPAPAPKPVVSAQPVASPVPAPVVSTPPSVPPPAPAPAPKPPPTYIEIQDCIKTALGAERYNDAYRRGYEMKPDEGIKIANCKDRGRPS